MVMNQSSGCGGGRSGWILGSLLKMGCPDFLILRVRERELRVRVDGKALVLVTESLEASLTLR